MKNQLITGALTLTLLAGTATSAFAGVQAPEEVEAANTAYAICTSATQLDKNNIVNDTVLEDGSELNGDAAYVILTEASQLDKNNIVLDNVFDETGVEKDKTEARQEILKDGVNVKEVANGAGYEVLEVIE